uniref:Uncharacterized protein n=1 Tax=Lotharella globosa TaxID=91324 RepID=A0A7S4DYJ0_9EUKA
MSSYTENHSNGKTFEQKPDLIANPPQNPEEPRKYCNNWMRGRMLYSYRRIILFPPTLRASLRCFQEHTSRALLSIVRILVLLELLQHELVRVLYLFLELGQVAVVDLRHQRPQVILNLQQPVQQGHQYLSERRGLVPAVGSAHPLRNRARFPLAVAHR